MNVKTNKFVLKKLNSCKYLKKDHFILISILLYVCVHVAVAVFSIRFWPFTDYPMFSEPQKKFKNISVIRFHASTSDGNTFWLPRSFAYGYGAAEFNLKNELSIDDLDKLKKFLRRNFVIKRGEYLKIIKVNIIRRRLLRIGQRHRFTQKDDILKTIIF